LRQTNRRLVADVSHALCTPLTTVRGYVAALEQMHGAHVPACDLALIPGAIGRLTDLIEDLFTRARADTRQLPRTLEPVDAGALECELTTTLTPLARRERQIALVTADLPLCKPPAPAWDKWCAPCSRSFALEAAGRHRGRGR
jgi:signal transduction histidine kinase